MTFLPELKRLMDAATTCGGEVNLESFLRRKSPAIAELVEKANAVIERWDTPTWKESEPTAHTINAMREALAKLNGGKHEG